jgi:uncharacterized membrane protein YidH (DUF202 family)
MSLRRLRIALAVLSVGFAFEGIGELYTFLTPGAASPGETALFLVPAILALVGVILMWAGRDGWTGFHRARAAAASRVFGASLLSGLIAAAMVAGLILWPSPSVPWWAPIVFGGAIGGLVLGTTATYSYLLYDLVSRPMKAVLLAAIAWTLGVSIVLAWALAANLGSVLALLVGGQLTVPSFVPLIDRLLSYLFVPFFLLLAAALEAQYSAARTIPTRRRSPDARGVNRRTRGDSVGAGPPEGYPPARPLLALPPSSAASRESTLEHWG